MQTADDAEDFERAFAGDPRGDEVVHAEGVDVAQVERCECFRGFVSMALCNVTVDSAVGVNI